VEVDIVNRIDAKAEFRLLILEHLHALDMPKKLLIPEVHFHKTRAWAFDYAIPELRLAFEYEGFGKGHLTWISYAKDCEKYTWASLLNWKLIRITAAMINDGRAGPLIRSGINVAINQDIARPYDAFSTPCAKVINSKKKPARQKRLTQPRPKR